MKAQSRRLPALNSITSKLSAAEIALRHVAATMDFLVSSSVNPIIKNARLKNAAAVYDAIRVVREAHEGIMNTADSEVDTGTVS